MMKVALGQLEFIHPTLREIALAVEAEFGEQVVTSIYRIGDRGVHGQLPVRGLDLRDLQRSKSKKIQAWVNARWKYDPQRPTIGCCLYHKNKWSEGSHLHLQVHERTIRMES